MFEDVSVVKTYLTYKLSTSEIAVEDKIIDALNKIEKISACLAINKDDIMNRSIKILINKDIDLCDALHIGAFIGQTATLALS